MAQHVFGLFQTKEAARSLIGALSPFVSHDRISVFTKADQLPDYATEHHETDSILDGTLIGAAIGGVLGITAAFATALYPTAGNLLVTLGPLAGGAYGLWSGGMLGGLIDLGISEPSARHIHNAIEHGHILLTAEVTDDNKHQVEQLFKDYGADSVITR
ncbi:MAG: hypothetical protein ACXVDE_00435 [Tumebacillaceae bacterium]